MNLENLLALLQDHPDQSVVIRLPDGTHVPAHFHVTEVGHVQKRFVVSQYPVGSIHFDTNGIVLNLNHKHTAYLAPDKCRIDLNVMSSCSGPDCC